MPFPSAANERRVFRRGHRRVTVAFWVALAFLTVVAVANASTAGDFLYGSVAKTAGEPADLPYRYLVPPGYNPAQRYPLIVFLHGSGERGSDNALQLANNANGALQLVSGQNQARYPAFMLAPQCPAGGDWTAGTLNQVERAMGILAATYAIDSDRIYVTGLSLGGAGTYLFASLYPELLAAAVPMSAFARGDVTSACGVPMWVFHAADDLSVGIINDDLAVLALRSNGARIIYTRYAIGGHAIWPVAYGTPPLLPWLMAQRRHQRVTGTPIVQITSPNAKLPALSPSLRWELTGTADFPDGAAFAVYWTYAPSAVMTVADGTGAVLATDASPWSVSSAAAGGNATSVVVLAKGPTWGGAFVGGGSTTVNDVAWVIPAAAAASAPPLVTVTAPSATGTWTTPDASFELGGTAAAQTSDPLQQITWENDRGGEGVALLDRTGVTTTWRVASVALQPGMNRFTIRARNAVSISASTSFTVQSTQAVPPTITVQPQSTTAMPGMRVTLALTADGTGPLQYQWSKDGAPVGGATNASLTLSSVVSSDAGNYGVRITNAAGACDSRIVAVSVGASPTSAGRLLNLSVRGSAGEGDQTLILGFTVGGFASLPVLMRGAGPALRAAPFGVVNALADPRLRQFQGALRVADNEDWGGDATVAATASRVGAYPFLPASKDAALVAQALPGSNAVHVIAPAGQTGLVLAEVYDASAAEAGSGARLTNLSARAEVGSDNAALIGGFVVGGPGPVTVLVRAVGPSLASFGVSNVLADPVLELHGAHARLATNDNWSDATYGAEAAALSASLTFPLPDGSKDAAVLATLTPGAYTAIVRGVNNHVGVALLEVYEVR